MEKGRFKIYTKMGDDGTTALVSGTRVKKNHLRLEAYGTIDELNAAIGLIRSYPLPDSITEMLTGVQNKLFNIGSRLASDEKGDRITGRLAITGAHIEFLERAIDAMEDDLPPLTQFILPGGDPASACAHLARTICRRAERRIIELSETEPVALEIIQYVNRLSDLLFVLARKLTSIHGAEEKPWEHD